MPSFVNLQVAATSDDEAARSNAVAMLGCVAQLPHHAPHLGDIAKVLLHAATKDASLGYGLLGGSFVAQRFVHIEGAASLITNNNLPSYPSVKAEALNSIFDAYAEPHVNEAVSV